MKHTAWILATLLVISVAVAYFRTGESVSIETLREDQLSATYVSLPDGVTHYQLEGPAEGDLILLIHGGREPGWTWDEVVPALNAAGYRTLRYDMFGRGFSDRPTNGAYDQAFFQRQVETLLDELNINTPIHVAGYSFGAAIAARLAVSRPTQMQSLAAIAPRFFAYPVPGIVNVPIIGDLLIKYLVKPNALDEVRGFFTKPDLNVKYFYRVGTPDDVYGNFLAFRRFALSDALAQTAPTYTALGAANIPTLIISGEMDAGITPDHIDAISALVPRATRVVIPQATHGLVWTHGQEIAREIIDWLN
jgi:pimeloyl-ACP methyl ester carboxylesterase